MACGYEFAGGRCTSSTSSPTPCSFVTFLLYATVTPCCACSVFSACVACTIYFIPPCMAFARMAWRRQAYIVHATVLRVCCTFGTLRGTTPQRFWICSPTPFLAVHSGTYSPLLPEDIWKNARHHPGIPPPPADVLQQTPAFPLPTSYPTCPVLPR